MKNRFYLACMRDNVGSNVSFHCKEGRGYSTDISKAEIYTLEEAQAAWNSGREFDTPISADHIDQVSITHVDRQCIPCETQLSLDESELYVCIVHGKYDGNDRYFITRSASSTDYTKAVTFTKSEVLEDKDNDVYFLPKSLVDNHTRKTFQIGNLNERTMIQGAGLKQPPRVKRHKARSKRGTTGKTRTNCKFCGKIVWDYINLDMQITCKSSACEIKEIEERLW